MTKELTNNKLDKKDIEQKAKLSCLSYYLTVPKYWKCNYYSSGFNKSKLYLLSLVFIFTNISCTKKLNEEQSASSIQEQVVIVQNLSTARLLNKNQILKSLYSVTGLEPKPDDPLISPALASDNNSLLSVTSPLMFSLAGSAGIFCDRLQTKEENAVTDTKKFFILLLTETQSNNRFTYKSNITEDDFVKTVELLAQSFWGRMPTAEEQLILKEEGFNYFLSTKSAANTKKLANFLCTSMLSSFETYTY